MKGSRGGGRWIAPEVEAGLAPGFGALSSGGVHRQGSEVQQVFSPRSMISSICPLSWSVYPVASAIVVIVDKSFIWR